MIKNIYIFLVLMALVACGKTDKKETPAANNNAQPITPTVAKTKQLPNKDLLLGSWQLESVSTEVLSEDEKQTVLTFNADGSCEAVHAGGEKDGDGKDTWALSADGKTLTVTSHKVERYEIISITDNTMEIKGLERGDVLRLRKV